MRIGVIFYAMPHPSIVALDKQLQAKGENIVIVRESYDAPAVHLPARAFVRGYRPEELVGGITLDHAKVILSPSGLWNYIPTKGDLAIIGGRTRSILAVGAIRIGDEVVRIELQVAG